MSKPVETAGETESSLIAGTDHMTVEGSDPEATIEFYRDVLGMPLVLRQPNLDRPDLTHLFFDTGDGRMVTFFVGEDRTPPEELTPDTGDVHHLAFRIETGRLDDMKQQLEDHGYDYSEYNRGAFHAIYTSDPNDLTIELVVDTHQIPDEIRGAVYARAQQYREDEDAEYVQDSHIEAAKDELGVDTDTLQPGEAPAGREITD
ncbi:MAG: lactoylglutathione lyase [Halorubrum sp. J07HR59]|jgi:Glyoxalase/Bleomycin resistance protein/Dioxygenase superfamily.|nr:MAG: lactoylglutathione lyase [Halorubrum sp. J07HR59]